VIRRLTIVGVGLLGGSVARAARTHRLAAEIVGIGRDRGRLAPAVADGTLDRATTDLAEGVRDADVVVLAATVLASEALLGDLWPMLPAGALVTDVGSTKTGIVRRADALAATRDDVHFVGSHPMAGSEKSGYGAARADLFRDALVILTPTEATAPAATKRVTTLWETMGARTVVLDPETHDRAVAAVSHLPHLVAWALVDAVSRFEPAALTVAARGFKDTTRIAASDPAVWREILLANRGPALASLDHFRRALDELTALVAAADGAPLEATLARIRDAREAVR
jgi:prephenate dehydrogenase